MIGRRAPRPDAVPKVTGATRFAADLPVAGLLHARIVPSLYAHARIVSIDASAAMATPGVVAVLTAADLPIVGRDDMRMFEPLAREEALFAGQPVALVVAETEAAAEDAAELVAVEADPLPAVVGLEAAMSPQSALARLRPLVEAAGDGEGGGAHAAVGGGGAGLEDEEHSQNVFRRKRYRDGDAPGELGRAAATVGGRFETSWVYQAYVEPHVATARFDPDGTLVVEAATQGIFYTRKQLARIFGLPVSQIRVTGAPLGGSFGSKVMLVEPLAAGAALALHRPVRVAFTRREDMAAANPASASVIELRIGADQSGLLTGLDARLVFDAGAYTEDSTEGIAAVLVAGPYRWPAFDVRAYGVRTNRAGTGSYRGPGGPQAAFALESLLDELAVRLGLDPLALRLRNLAVPGEPKVDGRPWPELGHRECVEALMRHPLWRDRATLPSGEGVGAAVASWPGSRQPAAASCRLNADGTLTVVTGVVDMTGTATAFAAIAAAAFGLPFEAVEVVSLDTLGAPQSPMSSGSVVTYSAGRAVREAAEDARRQLLAYAAQELEIDARDLEIVDGVVRPIGAPDRAVSVATLANDLHDWNDRHPPVEGHASIVQPRLAPSTAGHLVHVRLDRETGSVRILRHVVAQDVGRAVNPALVEGQMTGGALQGIGWALHEALVHDEAGQLLTGSFLDYVVPRSTQAPPFEPIIVEVPSADGPFGAKGIGEAPVLAVAAAVANAIAAAGGPRLRRLPMTAAEVWRAGEAPGG